MINKHQVQEIDTRRDPTKPLPQNKSHTEEFEFGYYEPNQVKEGKIGLRQSLELLTKYSQDPTKDTKKLAIEYKLSQELVGECLHFLLGN